MCAAYFRFYYDLPEPKPKPIQTNPFPGATDTCGFIMAHCQQPVLSHLILKAYLSGQGDEHEDDDSSWSPFDVPCRRDFREEKKRGKSMKTSMQNAQKPRENESLEMYPSWGCCFLRLFPMLPLIYSEYNCSFHTLYNASTHSVRIRSRRSSAELQVLLYTA